MLCLTLFLLGCSNNPMLNATNLRCEYKTNPLGIDKQHPRMDWRLVSDKPQVRDQKQSAYRVVVASTEQNLSHDRGDLWDSGIVKSDETTQISYAGTPLKSEQRAYWKVRVWDGDGSAGGWSKPAIFSMGFLNPDDWKAKWIGYDATTSEIPALTPLALDGLNWIWSDPKSHATKPASQFAGEHPAPGSIPIGTRYFRKTVTIPDGKVLRATASLAAEQRFELTINGSVAEYGQEGHRLWTVDIAPYLRAGNNVLGIWARSERPGHFGAMARFRIELENHEPITVDLDPTWKVATERVDGWDSAENPGGDWSDAEVVGKLGEGPFGMPAPRKMDLPPPPYLRKEFTANKPIARATLTASALGLYEMHLNGERVGRDDFTPGWTDYSKRVHYQTYDVTPMLKQGKNAIGAILGDGWYAGYFGFSGRRNFYGGAPRLIAQLRIEYADGSSDLVVSDDSWKAAYGPIREADLLQGCTYDANHEFGAWDKTGYDDSQWKAVSADAESQGTPEDSDSSVHARGKSGSSRVRSDPASAHGKPRLEASPGPTVQKIQELPSRSVTAPCPGVYVIDLGQNMVGWVRLKLTKTKPGQTIQLRYAEMLDPNGTPYRSSARQARATDTYISKGGSVAWEPKFTFHGFRYVEVTGLSEKPSLHAITGIVAHSQMDRTGEFECSNPLINQLVHNIIWGQKGNYFSIPTDCPQRDERLGWTGDAQFFIPTACYNFDVAAFFDKWLIDLCEDSADEEGAFGSVAPEVIRSKGSFGATAWADAGIVCPYTIWKVYGDTTVIRDHYAAMSKYIDYLHKTSNNLIRTQGAYGDWLNLGGGAKSEVIGTAYFEHVTRLMSEMSKALGKTDDAANLQALADDIRRAFIKEFITEDGRIKESSQTGYALAFAFNLIPEALREKAAHEFVEEIKKKDWHLATGFIGTPRLLPALSLAGRDDVAYRLLEQETYPGWLYQVKLGATTMWERWDGWTPDKGFQDPGMNSFNHYAFGSVGEWLYRTVGGIDTDGPGFKRIIVHPEPNGNLTWAKASYNSIQGKIESAWKLQDGQLTLDVTVPLNTTATISVPSSDTSSVTESGGAKPAKIEHDCAVYKVGSGRYHFTAKR